MYDWSRLGIKIVGTILAIIATMFVAVTLVNPALIASVVIPYEGTVTTPSPPPPPPPPPPPTVEIGVYWDIECTSAVSSVDVGGIEVGSTDYKTVYVRNEGDTAVTLSMSTENWSPPEASSYITLSWDYGGQSISPGDVVPVVLTLSVSKDISGITSFGFDLVITGSG